ncbi:YD repeat-containing protein, partial [Pragia fontium DSM 5563 = ATCC 49100]
YDSAGNLVMRNDSRSGTDNYHYDVLGQITEHSNPMGKIQRYVYSASGDRFVESTSVDGERELTFNDGVRYRLNQAGQLVARESEARSDRLDWDENECLSDFYDIGEREPRYQYRYDALGEIVWSAHYTYHPDAGPMKQVPALTAKSIQHHSNNLTSANKPAVPHHLPDDGKRISPPDTSG